jgi:phosphoribosyl-ATP pyrophosphohydrolase/phosphoribosyl-AMP cyclohydrolase
MSPNFKKLPLLPALIQNASTREVLMLGYMNQVAFEKTQATKQVWFYSRSKQRLWQKGETSGNILEVIEIRLDCDADAILVLVQPQGPTCHTLQRSCFGEKTLSVGFLGELMEVISQRKKDLPEGSYTTQLFRDGLEQIVAKVEEEAEEVVRAARAESDQRVVEEAGDLLYHLFVLLVERDVPLSRVIDVLEGRHSK